MMPLSYATPGEETVIRRVGGSPEVKKHLENLGFVVGSSVKVITTLDGNVIVKVKEARVAINDEMASRQVLGLTSAVEVANLVAFLLSDATKTMTGTSIVIDGGYTL